MADALLAAYFSLLEYGGRIARQAQTLSRKCPHPRTQTFPKSFPTFSRRSHTFVVEPNSRGVPQQQQLRVENWLLADILLGNLGDRHCKEYKRVYMRNNNTNEIQIAR
jgi:hypothetical protein